ncbi:MAG: polysaccharide pyruvyl transferase family protein [Intestinibacter bartlettii]|uniref:polysaccharide pyruvyl transferase family protein n=1 Tax=Intestinibacter bartlettii TaxID=261299 RepID=UPI0029068BB0|nr:polysaccharide pyruvyl transferase family protein [Intestinibacter bartlettii]MDU6198526.1 polysaccharide pyruvyl transferase family protein [Intestinibacter bartlettii]
MSKINLYYHAGSKNHGCEAIVRGTYKILQQDMNLFSLNPQEDKRYGINNICSVIHDKENNNIKKYKVLLAKIYIKLFNNIDLSIKNRRQIIINNVKKDDIYLSIGGDNYCYPGTDLMASLNRNLLKKGAKLVLWGCSVEPEKIKDNEISEDLSKFSLIVARESISYEALKKINKNTILCSDPAFQLDKVDLPLPKGFVENNTVGINVSPLIIGCESKKGSTMANYEELIKYIIDTTDMQIALIPHVVWENNDDRKPLKVLYDKFKDTGRVVMLEDHNCMELKGYISRCRFFIGARTHATIAAYSTCVPTLVIGYSVKAKGIAKDIFGTYENYVLPVQSLSNKDDLINAFEWMKDNEDVIRKHLNEFMPGYKSKALQGKVEIRKLLEE